ncbi:MAG: response regulator, partial [Prevotella sp.]|nr:response regulator [Prevotella sp.]
PGNIGYDVEMSEARPVHNPVTDDISLAVYGGFITFRPSDLKKSDNSPNIVFTGVLYQGNSEIEPLLNKDILDVASDRRNLTVYFAALEYSDKYLVKYAYKLDGVDDKWNYVGAANSASFNYLPAGRYKLLVKSTNCDGVWMDNVAELEIYAHPTFWETGWARLLYVLLFCGVICLIVYIYNLRSRAAMERELSELKTKFFTEISHNLRTPLTLIGAPVSEVLNTVGLTDSARRHLEMVQRNASRMLELVNKMLHYSMERGVYISDDKIAGASAPSAAVPAVAAAEAVSQEKREHILVVEDNDDVRDFLVSILQDEYNVLAAENGQRGLEIAETEMPDFIITDVMMPVMDGLTMVHRIKQNKDICHIPIIVLSAKASLQDRLDGLREGIDDYITKPFSAIYLKSRVSNIIRQRHLLQQAYLEQIKPEDRKTYSLEAPQIVDADNEMMNQLLGYLEEHISDASLKIDDLADAVNLGRSVFYGKIKSIVGMTPVDFVRHIRMQRAEQLIAGSNYPFSQIAYMVGFSDPKYFGKCFKKETGMTPSEYREKANGTVPANGI